LSGKASASFDYSGTNAIIYLGNSLFAAAGDDAAFRTLDVNKADVSFTFDNTVGGHQDVVNALAVVSNGVLASCSRDATVKIWDLNSNKLITTFDQQQNGHTAPVTILQALENNYLASASEDGVIIVWDINALQLKYSFSDHKRQITAFLAHLNFVLISASEDNMIIIWDLNQGAMRFTLTAHSDAVNCLAYISDKRFASGSNDNKILIWDVDMGKVVYEDGMPTAIYALKLLSNGILVAAGDQYIVNWQTDPLQPVAKVHSSNGGHTSIVRSIAEISKEYFATGSDDSTVKLWESNGLGPLPLYLTLSEHSSAVSLVSSTGLFDSNSTTAASGKTTTTLPSLTGNEILFASASKDKKITIYDALSGQSKVVFDYSGVYSIIYLGNGLFAAAGDDAAFRILNVYTADVSFTFDDITAGGHSDVVNALALLSNGYLASGSSDTTVKIWDISSYSLITTFDQQNDGHKTPITTLLSLENNYLASASEDGVIIVWDINALQLKYSFSDHKRKITAFLAHLNFVLISASEDNTIIIWDLNQGAMRFTLTAHSDVVNCLVYISDKRFASGSVDRRIIIWDVDTGVDVYHSDMPTPISALKLLSNGFLVVASDQYIVNWQTDPLQPVAKIDAANGGHSSIVRSIAEISKEYFATGSDDFTVKIWESNGLGPLPLYLTLTEQKSAVCFVSSFGFFDLNSTTSALAKTSTKNSKTTAPNVIGNELLFASASRDKQLIIYDALSGQSRAVFHYSASNSIIYLDNGLFAAAGHDAVFRIYNPYTASVSFSFDATVGGHSGEVSVLALLSNSYLASGSTDTTVKIWDLKSNSLITTFDQQQNGHTAPVTILQALENNYLASGSEDGAIKVWDVAGLQLKYSFSGANQEHKEKITALLAHSNFVLISASLDHTIIMWDLNKGSLKYRLTAHTDAVNCLAYITEKRFASGSNDRNIIIWDTNMGTIVYQSNIPTPVYALKLLANGYLVTAGDQWIITWQTEPFQAKAKVDASHGGHNSIVRSIAEISKEYFATGSDDFTVKIWESNGQGVLPLHSTLTEHTSPVNVVCSVSNFDQFYSNSNSTTKLLATTTTTSLAKTSTTLINAKTTTTVPTVIGNEILFASASTDSQIIIWEAMSGKAQAHFYFAGSKSMVALGSGLFAAAGDDSTFRILNAFTADIQATFDDTAGGHSGAVNALTLLSNGYLASGSFDTTIKIWNINSNNLISTFDQQDGHRTPVTVLLALDNNYLASGSEDGTVKVWDINGLQLKYSFSDANQGHKLRITALLAHLNFVLISASEDNTIIIWDLNQGAMRFTLTGHTNAVNCLAYISDKRFASGSSDTYLKIWDVNHGNVVYQSGTPTTIYALKLLSNGFLVTAGDKWVVTWQTDPLQPVAKVDVNYDGHNAIVRSIAEVSKELFATGSDDSTVKLWKSNELGILPLYLTLSEHSSEVNFVCQIRY
jgi:WD40 repeat protein